jgi:hypothetical protein
VKSGRGLQEVWETADRHHWHVLEALMVASRWQFPPIQHRLDATSHRSNDSLQVTQDAVHGLPAEAQTPPTHVAVPLHHSPSSHEAPAGRGHQDVRLAAGSQNWQRSVGFPAPAAQQAPSIQQPLTTSHASVDSLQVRHDSVHRAPEETQVPAAHASEPLHHTPSSQAEPLGRLVHAVGAAAASQYWHRLPGR